MNVKVDLGQHLLQIIRKQRHIRIRSWRNKKVFELEPFHMTKVTLSN